MFELTESVALRNVPQALKILNQMLTHGEDSVKIISLLAWQIKRLWRAKQILNGGGMNQWSRRSCKYYPSLQNVF